MCFPSSCPYFFLESIMLFDSLYPSSKSRVTKELLSYPLQRTLYRVVFTLPSSTWMWKYSPIPTICSEIHCIEPSFCCARARFRLVVFVLVFLSDVLGVEVFLSTPTVSSFLTLFFCWNPTSGTTKSRWSWERSGIKGLIISDNQAETCLIITINDISIGNLPLIITISDDCKNQTKRLDFDNTINLSSLIVSLDTDTFYLLPS